MAEEPSEYILALTDRVQAALGEDVHLTVAWRPPANELPALVVFSAMWPGGRKIRMMGRADAYLPKNAADIASALSVCATR